MSQQEKEEWYDEVSAMINSGNTKIGLYNAVLDPEEDELYVDRWTFYTLFQGNSDDPRIEFQKVSVYTVDETPYLNASVAIVRRGEDIMPVAFELDGQGGGGGGAVVADDGSVWVNGVPACANPFIENWFVGDDPQYVPYESFRFDPSQWQIGDIYRWNYRGYNIGETIQTPAYITHIVGNQMFNSYVRLINNSDDSVEIVFFAWSDGSVYYNTNGDLEDIGQQISLQVSGSTTVTGANGVVFTIEHYTDDETNDTDTYKLCKWRITSISGGSVRVDDRPDDGGKEMFQAILCKTPGEPDAPDAIRYKGRKSWYLHPPQA